MTLYMIAKTRELPSPPAPPGPKRSWYCPAWPDSLEPVSIWAAAIGVQAQAEEAGVPISELQWYLGEGPS